MNGLKKGLYDAKGKLVEELSHVLWTYQVTPRKSTKETPFTMNYKAVAIIPLENEFPMLRTSSFTSRDNDGLLEKSLDLIEEGKENAKVQLMYYQQAQTRIRLKCEVKAISTWGLSIKNGFRYCKEPRVGKVRAQLGKVTSYHLDS